MNVEELRLEILGIIIQNNTKRTSLANLFSLINADREIILKILLQDLLARKFVNKYEVVTDKGKGLEFEITDEGKQFYEHNIKQSQNAEPLAAILGIKEAKQLLDKQLGLAEEPIRTSWVDLGKKIDSMHEQLVKFIHKDKEFKSILTLLLSQMRDSQQISQEAFYKLNTRLQYFLEGDTADLDSF